MSRTAIYIAAKEDLLSGALNLLTAGIKAVPVRGGYVPDFASHEFLSDIASGDRAATPVALSGKSLVRLDGTTLAFRANPVAFPAVPAGDDIIGLALFDDTGTASSSRLIGWFDYFSNLPLPTSGLDVTFSWPTYGVFILQEGVLGGPAGSSIGLDNDIVFAAGAFGSSLNDPAANRCGVKGLDMSKFPATVGARVRQVRFLVALENAVHSASYYAKAHLYDLTHGVIVTGSALDNSGETDRGIVKEFTSGLLTVGSSSGNIRSDAPALYAVRFSGNGITDTATERAILSGARLEIRYV